MKRAHLLAVPLVLSLLLSGCLPGFTIPSVYDEPYPVRPITLPADDAAHDSPVEWWYWVGHLETESGRNLAFQLTFFEAFAPPYISLLGVPAHWWLDSEIVAHAARTDLDVGEHAMRQHGVVGESYASRDDLDIVVRRWSASRNDDGISHDLAFEVGGTLFDLTLTPTKPASLHGDPPGIQTMGPGGVSYYVSHTRMAVTGTVAQDCFVRPFCDYEAVDGQAWFDHQWGDFRIDQFLGWDWFALQFEDGAEAMLYLIREEEGYIEAAGSYVDAAGMTTGLTWDDFTLTETGETWTSEETSATYPAGWRVEIPEFAVDVTVTPMAADQEMNTRATTGIVYWEGAVEVTGNRTGVGFVELTNYDRNPFEEGGRFF